MNGLYLSQHELSAIKAIDIHEVERHVNQALDEGRPSVLFCLNLSNAGSHITDHMRRYERDLTNYAKAKAAAKRSETRGRAWSSGRDLIYAVRDMKQRVEEHEKEIQLLQIDDLIRPPSRFQDRVEVRVHYQWRTTVEATWEFRAITFYHDVDMRPNYTRPQPARKPSAAKLEEQRQDTLSRHWDHLRTLALHSVREFLKAGGDGSTIPEKFEAKPGRTDRYLNNFSCNFWGESGPIQKPEPVRPAILQVNGPSDDCSSDCRFTLQSRVKHAKFGEGIVIHIKADKITADFGERGRKRVISSFLEPLG